VVSDDRGLARAYAYCEALARAHYENFPVASRLLPAPMRPHIAAIYAFARTADDFADEPGRQPQERLRLLDAWSARLGSDPGWPESAPAGSAGSDPAVQQWERSTTCVGAGPGKPGEAASAGQLGSDPHDLIFVALRDTMRKHRLPRQLFADLLSAFRQDVTTTRYEDWDMVLDYCRRSANPIGRLVLRVAGYDDPRLDRASDAVCTALQLTNFWQDLARDWAIGRVYVPLDERRRLGARDEDLAAGRMTPEWQRVMALMLERTRRLFADGRAVCDGVHGRLRWELRVTWLGGTRILDKLERVGFDVFHRRPTLGASDVPALAAGALLWH
jgi:squalene synthase HpnC